MEMCSGGPVGTSGGQFQFVALQPGPAAAAAAAFLPTGFALAQPTPGISVACSVAQQPQQSLLQPATNSSCGAGASLVSSTTSGSSISSSASNASQQQPRRLAPRSIMPKPLAPKASAPLPLKPKPQAQQPSRPAPKATPPPPPQPPALPTTTAATVSIPTSQAHILDHSQAHALTRPASCTFQAFQLPTQFMTTAAIFAAAPAAGGGLFFSANSDALGVGLSGGGGGGGAVFLDDCSVLSDAVSNNSGNSKPKKSKKKVPARPNAPVPVTKPHALCHSFSDSNLLRRTESSRQSPGGQDLLLMACQEAGLHLGDEAFTPDPPPPPSTEPQQTGQQPEQVPNIDSSVDAAASQDNSLLTELGLIDLPQKPASAAPDCHQADVAARDKPGTPPPPVLAAADDSLLKLFDQPVGASGICADSTESANPAAATAAPCAKPDSSTLSSSVTTASAAPSQATIEDKVITVDDSITEAVDAVESAEKLLFSDSFVESWNDCLQFATLEAPPPPPLPPILEAQLPRDAAAAVPGQLSAPAPSCNRVLSETLHDRPVSPLPPLLHPESAASSSTAPAVQPQSAPAEPTQNDFLESLNNPELPNDDLADCWSEALPAMPAMDFAGSDVAAPAAVTDEAVANDRGLVSNCQSTSIMLDEFFELNTAAASGNCQQNLPNPDAAAAAAESPFELPTPPLTLDEADGQAVTEAGFDQQPPELRESPPAEAADPPPAQTGMLNTPTAGSVLTAAMALNYAPRDPPALLRSCPPLQFPPSPQPPPRLVSPVSRASTASTVPAVAASDCDDDADIGNRTLMTLAEDEAGGRGDAEPDCVAADLPPPVLSPAPAPDARCPSPVAYSPISEPDAPPCSMSSASAMAAAPPSASSDQCPPSTRPSSTFVDEYDYDGGAKADDDSDRSVVASPMIDTLVKAMLSATESLETSGTPMTACSVVGDQPVPPPPPPVLVAEASKATRLSNSSSSSSASGDLSAPSLACLARQIVQSATEAEALEEVDEKEEDYLAPPQLDRIVSEPAIYHSPTPPPPLPLPPPPPRLSKAALKCNYEKPRQFDLVPPAPLPPPPPPPSGYCSGQSASPSKRGLSAAAAAAVAKYSPKKPLKLLLKEKRRAMAAAKASSPPGQQQQCQSTESQPTPAAVSTPVQRLRIKMRPIRSPKKSTVEAVKPAEVAPSDPLPPAAPVSTAVGGLKIRLNLKSLGLASSAEPSVEASSGGGQPSSVSKRRRKTKSEAAAAVAAATPLDGVIKANKSKERKKRKSKSSGRAKSSVEANGSDISSAGLVGKNRHKRSRLSVEDDRGCSAGVGNSAGVDVGEGSGCVRERLTLRLPLRHSWAPSAN